MNITIAQFIFVILAGVIVTGLIIIFRNFFKIKKWNNVFLKRVKQKKDVEVTRDSQIKLNVSKPLAKHIQF